MRNPVRSEDAAFTFVLVTLGALALIALGSWISTWLGVAFAIGELLVLAWFVVARGGRRRPRRVASRHSPPCEHRVLVLADDAVGGQELLDAVRARAEGRTRHVLVVVPLPAPAVAEWTGDAGDAREVAQSRLDETVRLLRSAGLDARGELGEIDARQAVEDALRTFAADELLIASPPDSTAHWGEDGPLLWAQEHFALPASWVKIDGAASQAGKRLG